MEEVERCGDNCCVGGLLMSTTLLPPPVGPPRGRWRWGRLAVPGRPEEKWDQLCGWLTGNPEFRLQLASHKKALRDHMGYSQETADPSNKARRTDPPTEVGSSEACHIGCMDDLPSSE